MQTIANHCGRLSHIISRFKTAVTKYARKNAIPFAWQSRFHDRIVRDTDEFNRIAGYIERNTAQWAFRHEKRHVKNNRTFVAVFMQKK